MKNLLLVICCLGAAPALRASSLLYFTPSTASVAVGDNFELDLSIGALTQYFILEGEYTTSDLYAFQVEVDFDPTVFQVTNVNEGTLLPDYAASIGTSTAWFGGIVDNDGGSALVLDSLTGENYGAYTGNGGQLFSIDFQAITVSSGSTISISNMCMQNYHGSQRHVRFVGPGDWHGQPECHFGRPSCPGLDHAAAVHLDVPGDRGSGAGVRINKGEARPDIEEGRMVIVPRWKSTKGG